MTSRRRVPQAERKRRPRRHKEAYPLRGKRLWAWSAPWKQDKAAEMRANPTEAEAHLWHLLKGLTPKWYSQVVIRGWIVDFWCPAAGLVVEVDGPYHTHWRQQERDAFRDQTIKDLGARVLRVQNEDVLYHDTAVMRKIKRRLR